MTIMRKKKDDTENKSLVLSEWINRVVCILKCNSIISSKAIIDVSSG